MTVLSRAAEAYPKTICSLPTSEGPCRGRGGGVVVLHCGGGAMVDSSGGVIGRSGQPLSVAGPRRSRGRPRLAGAGFPAALASALLP